MDLKPTNPKDLVGIHKVSSSVIPRQALNLIALGLMEGDVKYGAHNYRVDGVLASVYFDAVHRHLDAYWEGQDDDPDSHILHLAKAAAGLIVWMDAKLNGMERDDRPPRPVNPDWLQEMNTKAAELLARVPRQSRRRTQQEDGSVTQRQRADGDPVQDPVRDIEAPLTPEELKSAKQTVFTSIDWDQDVLDRARAAWFSQFIGPDTAHKPAADMSGGTRPHTIGRNTFTRSKRGWQRALDWMRGKNSPKPLRGKET